MGLFGKNLGIDLGTVNVLIYDRGEIVLQEPSIVALSTEPNEDNKFNVWEIGQPALEMLGKVYEEEIQVTRPLQNGVIADFEATEVMLAYFLSRVSGRFSLVKPRVVISVPYGATSVERRAVHEAAIQAGARDAYPIAEPLAAAIGAGLPITTPAGDMVVNIGGGITEAAVISMNNIVRAQSGRTGGLRLDEAIISYIRRKYNLLIGQPTAESIKIQIGAAIDQEQNLKRDIQGRDNVNGLPRTVTISTAEVVEALNEPLNTIAGVVKSVLSETPPELAADIMDRGIVLTGGGALLRGIDRFLAQETRVPVYRAEHPMIAVASGCGRALEDPALFQRILQGI